MRWWTHGDPLYVKRVRPPYHPRGTGNPSWKGDDAGYTQVHRRIYKALGKAKDRQCRECGQPAAEWAYTHTDPEAKVAIVSGCELQYSLDQSHYAPMCVPCHRRFDREAARGL